MYKLISNEPNDRATITPSWCFWDDMFTDEDLLEINRYCQSHKQENGQISGEDDHKIIKKIRSSKISFHHPNEDTKWIFEKLNCVIEQANDRFWNFDLNGYSAFQYSTYDVKEKGKYDWHMDTYLGKNNSNTDTETRKLSLTLSLNDDFEGGEFQIITGNPKNPETVPTKKGRCILFPSWVLHKVAPVTKGIRQSVVVWVLGPKFI
jgi:PKHD-type hydroxylase